MVPKNCLWLITAFVLVLRAFSEEVSLHEATLAADNWLGADSALGCPLGQTILSARTCHTPGGAFFHILRVAGGGFVVVSSDTTHEPIVAFSSDDDLIEDESNPFWVLLCRDFDSRGRGKAVSSTRRLRSAAPSAAERKWARLLGRDGSPRKANALSGRTSVSDLRVAPFVQSKWGQTTVGGENFYNLRTPDNCPVGCVATAGAQVMRYLEWPRTAVPAFSNTCCAVDGAPVTLTAFGGLYDWDDMPLCPDDSATEKQKTAIAGLMSDLGVACGMSYGASGSAAGSYMLARAWTTSFGYASAMAYALPGDLPAEVVKRALISNFDARFPVEIGISGASGGHAVVGDGYGYSDGTLYYHLNMGWDGNGNAWYAPPDLSAGGYSFSAFGCVVYNIFPELSAGHTICSGRVLDAYGMPIAGATVRATDFWNEHYETTTDDHGIYALILPSTWVYPLPYTIHAELNGESSDDLSIKVKMCVSTLVNADGTFNSNTAPAPAINNLIDQDLTISSVFGDAPEGDYFANPIQIAGASGSHLLEDTSGYSLEEGEPHHSLDNGSYYPEARSAWYSWTAPGNGEMSFTVLSRHKIGSTTYYLHAMVAVYRGESLHSAVRIALYDGFGDDGGTTVKFEAVRGERYRIVVFAYAGDPFTGPFALSWEGELALADATQTTEIPIPHSWLVARYPEADDFERLAFSLGANGRPVWESYLLGLEPTNAMSDLRITQFWIDGDGTPNFGWNVTNENLRALGYEYRIKGKTKLEGGESWHPLGTTHRFFRLFVEKSR